jgi:hypothetical protein
MAENKEKYSIDFQTNADAAAKDVQGLSASIDQSTEAAKKNKGATDNQEESYKTLKVQLREAIVEQQKLSAQYGSTSAEAIKATKAVAGIKDEIGFQKKLVESYNPDDKFRKLTQTAGVAALALGGVKDGFSALGIESKVLDKVIGSAQAILGVTSAVAGMSDAYAVLTAAKKAKVATDIVEAGTTQAVAVAEGEAAAATWSWNAALLANPAIAIAAGILALGAGIYAFVKITGDAVKEEEKAKVASMQLTVAIDNQAKAFENNNKFATASNSHKIEMLRARGASEAQIYKETKALAEQELQLAKNYRAEAILAEQKAYEVNRDNPTEFNAATLKKAQENIEKAKTAVSVGYDGLISLQNSHEVAVVQAQTDAAQKAQEKAEQARQKEIDDAKKAQEKAIQDKKEYLAKANEVEDEFDLIKSESLSEKRQSENDAMTEYLAAKLVIETNNNEERKRTLEQAAEEEIRIENYKKDQKKAIQDGSFAIAGQAIELAKTLGGKSRAIQKAALVAESAVGIGKTIQNTVTGNAAALAQGIVQAGPIAGPAIAAPAIATNTVLGGLSVATNIAATVKALGALGGGGAPSAGGAIPSVSGVGATPQTGFQASSENQIATSISAQQNNMPIIKTYVVGSEVKTQTDLDAKLIQQNSFG